MSKAQLIFFLACAALPALSGCAEVSRATGSTWHEKCDWKAKNYFDDPQVIALCKAIEANDIKEIDRLVAAGAKVNAQGKGNMTPLLWAFPDNKPERFKKLLELGADPNVIVESDFNTRMSGIRPGDSVTHMVCESWFPKHFDYVFQHGGDPNLWHREHHESPIFLLIRGPAKGKREKLQRLIELGADLDANEDYEFTGGRTPVMVATSCFGQYDIALQLLEAGADYKIYKTNSNMKLVHTVLREERRLPIMSPAQKANYQKLVKWLEKHGESFEDAREDEKRWRSRVGTPHQKKMMRNKEVAERKAREAREND